MDKARISELYRQIKEYDTSYYGDGVSRVTDREHDTLYKELLALEEQFPELKIENSPTSRVGDDLTGGFAKVAHKRPMKSIDNSYSSDDIAHWVSRTRELANDTTITFTAELKMDGVACSLHYSDGKLVQAVTRGNGSVGDDITANVRTIRSIPLTISQKDSVEIRGEIYMTFANFQNLNTRLVSEGKSAMQNPRNTTAGAIKLLSPQEVSKRNLSFCAYYLLSDSEPPTHLENLSTLKRDGFSVVEHSSELKTDSDVVAFCDEWNAKRFDLGYPVDGIVIKVNQLSLYEKIGTTSKAPRWAIAYKYEAEKADTTILAIDIQMGRTGIATPVARLEPVELAGTTVQNCTLHNFDEIERLGVNIGDVVTIEKSGEIIPKVLKVSAKKSVGNFVMPTECPSCGTDLVKLGSEVAYRCLNGSCPEKRFAALSHFVSRNAMDIAGCGPAVLQQLLDSELITDAADLYTLTSEELLTLDRMGEKSATKLISAFEKSKQKGLASFINGIGIPQVGASTAKILAKAFGSLSALMDAKVEVLIELDTIGDEIADSIISFFASEENKALMEKFTTANLLLEEEVIEQTGELPLAGHSYVVTGTLSKYGRKEAGEILERAGAKISSSVSKKTTGLIAGEKAGSKLAKAEKLGVPVLSEDFIDTYK